MVQCFLRLIPTALTENTGERHFRSLFSSGQMQDVIPVGSDRHSLGNAILYSDGRAGAQAEAIENAVGSDTITAITGNHFDGSMPPAKILWLKENQPEILSKKQLLFSSVPKTM